MWRWLCAGVTLAIFFFITAAHSASAQEAPVARSSATSRLRQRLANGRRAPGEIAARLRYRAWQQKLQLRTQQRLAVAYATTPTTSGAGWSPLGPAPLASDASGTGFEDYNWVSGRATAVAVDPADSAGNTVYLGGAYGGVWKSANAGPASSDPSSVIWTPLTDAQATLAIGALAIQPGNNDATKSVILAGTGETDSTLDSYYGLGILRSADGGTTWSLISADSTGTRSFAGLGFSKIAFSSAIPSLVVAATAGTGAGGVEGLEDPLTVNRGIYYSQDAGVTWNYATIQDGSSAVVPGSVTSVAYNAGAGKFYAAVRFHGFYSSSDGITWTRLSNQPAGLTGNACPANPSSSNCPLYRAEIAAVPGRNEMYVWYVDITSTDQGIWRTLDGGANWTPLTESGITACGDDFGCGAQQGYYNLALAAIPNGAGTDLYAGNINIYKCSMNSASPTCGGSGANTFLNLTHVYGCPPNYGSIARVHPNQHAIGFMVTGGQAVLYFANDGGIYRALDGFSGLLTGTCGGSNQFNSLNETLGAITQLVSFSQHPSDGNTLLGGTQGNGSPATSSVLTSTSWFNVNNSDGGYNAINPANPNEWFVANTGVSIQKCTVGPACRLGNFISVVSAATVGGDTGALYTPYLLDPQNSGELLLGTCRVWRGTSDGAAFSALSNNFDTGSGATCTGAEVNLTRALAAGGPADADGFSNVIFAGTDGYGPLMPTSPAGGKLWVTTNAAGGASTWSDQTGAINPKSYPISGIALDKSDGTGKTAYVSIQGFHTSHVWKTTTAGSTWIDFTADLPDAPANAILVDPGVPSTGAVVYVATDVGVFSSPTTTPVWTEVGPNAAPGVSGFLPNVAVTALAMFNSGGQKLLRASTYGRGLWQFPLITSPDFQFTTATPSLTVFPSQSATFQGSIFALNGYSSAVTLSCTAGSTPAPASCTPSPSSITPSSSGTAFSVTASGTAADYAFNLHGVGANAIHDLPLALHVMDFSVSGPSPVSVTVNRPGTSAPVALQVASLGAFSGAVTLACNGLPSGATCNFSPGSSVTPAPSAPVAVTLTIATSSTTSTGAYTVTITGSAAGAPTAKEQTLSLTVSAVPDFSLTASPSPLAVPAGNAGQISGTFTFFNGYAGAITLTCSAGAPANCAASVSGSAFTVTVQDSRTGSYSFNLVAAGNDAGQTTHSLPVQVQVWDFTLSNASGAISVKAGQTASYFVTVSPVAVSSFPGNVTLGPCSGLPTLASCSFLPAQIDANSLATTPTVKIATQAPMAQLSPRRHNLAYAFALLLPGIVVLRDATRKSKKRYRILTGIFLLLLLAGFVSCGGGLGGGNKGQPGTPPGTYTISFSATSGPLTHNVSLTLTVQ